MAVNVQSATSRLLGAGDRFFGIIRFLSLGLLTLLALRLDAKSLFPPGSSQWSLVWWAYALFAVLMSVAIFAPALRAFIPWLFVVDQCCQWCRIVHGDEGRLDLHRRWSGSAD